MNNAAALIKYGLAGIFGLALLTYLAKDGQQLGDFISASGDGVAKFAKGIQAT